MGDKSKRQQLEQDVIRGMALRGTSLQPHQARAIVGIVLDGLREPTDMMILVGSMEVPAFKGTGAARNYVRVLWNAMLDQIT